MLSIYSFKWKWKWKLAFELSFKNLGTNVQIELWHTVQFTELKDGQKGKVQASNLLTIRIFN